MTVQKQNNTYSYRISCRHYLALVFGLDIFPCAYAQGYSDGATTWLIAFLTIVFLPKSRIAAAPILINISTENIGTFGCRGFQPRNYPNRIMRLEIATPAPNPRNRLAAAPISGVNT